ncbi:MAG TPA: tetratricopeptide repeat protein [Spirochaetia bacterium]|nr:tetratricopeptide repeat protein [Spirochaetia bacterium]
MESFHSGPEFISGMRTYMAGDREKSLATLGELLEKNPNDASLHVLIGNLLYSQGSLAESAQHYERALQLAPAMCQAWYKLGVCYVRMGKLREARTAFQKNVEADCGTHMMSYYWMGLINNFMGHDELAQEAFSVLRKESPESLLANYFLAQLHMKRNEHAKALELLEELVKTSPDFAEAHFLLGEAYAGLYRNFDAVRCFRRAVELNPDDRRAQMMLEHYTEDSSF